MGAAGDLLLTLVGLLVVSLASIEVASGCLVAFWLLVPGLLVVPYAPHILLVDRLVLYVFALRLVLRAGRPGQPSGGVFALTPVHAALAVVVMAAFATGVLLASPGVSLSGDLHAFLYVLDLIILFVVVLASVRTIGLRRFVNVVVCGVLVVVVIGFVERITNGSWGHFFFSHLPANYVPGIAPGTLGVRGASVRSQGAAQFALEYGWVLVMLLPLTVSAALNWSNGRGLWRKAALLSPLAVFVAIVFSGARSAIVAAVVAVPLFLLASGADRRLLRWLGLALIAGVLVALFDPSLVTAPFSAGSASDPATVRFDRLPLLFSLVVHRPWTGLGFNGVSNIFGGVDNGYALMYSTVGMIGITAWITLMVTAMATAARTLRAPRGSEGRTIGAACLIGMIAVAVAMATYDLVNTLQSLWAFVILAALGVAAFEASPIGRAPDVVGVPRAVLPLVGAGVGCMLFLLAPMSSSQTYSVFLTATWLDYESGGPVDVYDGTVLANTFCGALTSVQVLTPGTDVHCLQNDVVEPFAFPAQAVVTVSGATPKAVAAATKRVFDPIFHHQQMTGAPTEPIQTGRPAWAETAPLWCGMVGFLAMAFVPPLPVRRRPRRTGQDDTTEDRSDAPNDLERQSLGV